MDDKERKRDMDNLEDLIKNDPDNYDCRGGAIYGLCVVVLFWVVISMTIWYLT